jgi:hypothetical protein
MQTNASLGWLRMNEALIQRLENLPLNEARSRLEPYREVILRWRRQGRSYRIIQRILADECKLAVSHKAILKFVRLRTRPRKQAEPDLVTETPADAKPIQSKPSLAEQKAAQFAAKQALLEKSRTQATETKLPFAFGWEQQSTRDRKG